MEVTFTVESTNGKVWKAVCSDPALEVEGSDIISVSKNMAGMIEDWFAKTFDTSKRVIVEVPAIKAKVKATITVRSEKPLTEYGETEVIPQSPPEPKLVCGPCMYLSDGKGVLAVGQCEAASDDPADTPGIQVDADGTCKGNYEICAFYKPLGRLQKVLPEPTPWDGADDEKDVSEWEV